MNVDRLIATAECEAAAVLPATSSESRHVGKAPVTEVLYEQLEYLLSHGGRDCSDDCLDCSRLERVHYWLLLPFED